VELGIERLQPLATTKAVVRLDDERAQRRLTHWQQIAVAACEQSGRNRVPEILPVLPLRAWLGNVQQATRILLSPRAAQRVADLAPGADIVLLAGPEGGFTAEEEEAARITGFTAVSLGPRTLRTETAALAALAALQARWGDL
jgi:16S rRNA (uracil1498-N3)-methyltransferase